MVNYNIVVSVVCYNNEDEVIAFANQLANQSASKQIQLIVTCNSVQRYDYLNEKLKTISIKTQVYNPTKNLGYLPGCLYGVSKSNLPEYYWLMISNTDLSFTSDTFFEDILSKVEPDAWCLGPNIALKATGKRQNPFFVERPSKMSMSIRKVFYSNYFFYKIYFRLSEIKNRTNIASPELSSLKVYAVHGSCFLLNSEIVPTLIQESRNIFMYGEELLVAEIVRMKEKCTYYNSEVSIIHNENQVTGTITSKRKQQWFKQSTDYLVKRFYK